MRGFKDNIPPISHKFEYVRKNFEEISNEHAVNLIELPLVENASLYFRTSGEESEICNKELFEVRRYKGDFEDWVLRPEGTASCIRAIKESNFLEDKKICRLGYYGPMFRYNRPQKGRYRQFNQAGWEWLGSNNKYTDLEIILAGCKLLNKLGISYKVEINSIGNIEDRAKYRKELREHFKVEEDPFKILDKLDEFKEIPKMGINQEDKNAFEFVLQQLKQKNVNVIHNPYLVRGLDYYNGMVMEFKHEGQTILAGGRYDGLMEQIGGTPTPAIGFALGVDRVVDILNYEEDKSKNISIISLGEEEYDYSLSEKIREFGFKVHPLWGMDIGKGLKFASKTAKYAIIVGDTEREKGTFIIKDLEKFQQKECSINVNKEDLLNF